MTTVTWKEAIDNCTPSKDYPYVTVAGIDETTSNRTVTMNEFLQTIRAVLAEVGSRAATSTMGRAAAAGVHTAAASRTVDGA